MPIEVTLTALDQIRCLVEQDRKKGWGLRMGVKGGGCSGLSYTMQFEEKPGEHDKVQVIQDIPIFIDPKSYLYLNGMTLDFSTDLIGGGFNFVNPNATQTCSCGQSFSA